MSWQRRMRYKSSQQSLFAFCFLLDLPLAFYQLQSPRVDHLTSGSTACTILMCLQRCFLLHSGKWDTLVSPGKCCSVYWENCGWVPPAPVPPILVCPSLLPIMYSFCWTSCTFQGGANLCKRVSSFLVRAHGSSVWELRMSGALINACCTNFSSPFLAGLSGMKIINLLIHAIVWMKLNNATIN